MNTLPFFIWLEAMADPEAFLRLLLLPVEIVAGIVELILLPVFLLLGFTPFGDNPI